MELNITKFFSEACPKDYSASVAEIGNNAGVATYQAAKDDSEEFFMLDTEEKKGAFREHVKGFGAWEAEEIAAWNDTELNALLIQMISGDIREGDLDDFEPDWEDYEKRSEAGNVSGRLFKGDDGQVYYLID